MRQQSNSEEKQQSDDLPDVQSLIERTRRGQENTLNLSNRGLTEIPEVIGQLAHLDHLDLSNNNLAELPEVISKLTQIRHLNLSGNQLATLPNSITKLTHLNSLNLSNNHLTSLPESVVHLSQLYYLHLENNQLVNLPGSVAKLTKLEILFLSYNGLRKVPDILGTLTKLRVLWLDNNQITTLPTSIMHLTHLEELYVYNNRLAELPTFIGKLNSLQKLVLSGNQLAELPEELLSLESLKAIYLHRNPALKLPEEVLGPEWHDVTLRKEKPGRAAGILNYYFKVRSGQRPLNEAKLILVGRGTVGKTSMVNRLVHNEFKDEKKTEGIKITEWPIRLNGNEDVKLNIWDFGGQEIMHATHQFFLTQRSLYLLVLNGREGGEDADAEYWLKLIESFGSESPVIVVLNKIEEHPFDVNRHALQQKYPAIREFVKTDCEDGTGLRQLRRAIERETDRLEHLRDAFPASWFTIKDKLGGMRKNYLSFDEYRKACEKLGEKDTAAQESLAFYLHSLGVALNYRDDPRLEDTHVLNPHWVTTGIYKILNAKKLEKQKGEIRLKELSGILDGRTYPAKMHCFLFDLMKKFELCFSFPDEETHYLIPELLDKQEAPEAGDFKPEDCLNFQYQYPIVPEGLLPRFIVRTHVLSEGQPRWRSGVILKFEGNLALVKADAQDKKVFISVSGPALGRRRLLAIIRSDFERIHSDIRNLQPQEMVPVPGYPRLVIPYKKLQVMEENGVRSFAEVVDNKVIELGVFQLLNGVDLDGTRQKDRIMNQQEQAVRVFYSYSHKDETLRNELETHLKLLQRQGWITTWHDRNIDAGDDWKQRIDENLERADIILLLVSSDFMASDYCYDKEMTRALERHQNKEARVIPIVVRDVNWRIAPFAKLQALPKDGKAVTTWDDKDTAWRNVSEGIEKVVSEMRTKA